MARPVRLLYIDDDAGLGRLLQRFLAASGIEVRHVASGEEGLRLLAAEPYDVVALDHTLEGETGLDIIPRIRAIADAPPVIYVTGSDDARIAVAALKAGAVDYVWKDVQGHYRELLGQSIAAALAQEQMRRAHEEANRAVREARDRAEMLLGEVNHRVANSLSMVAALARLQSNVVTDAAARDALVEMQARIAAIAGVHRRLYTSPDVRFVDLDPYLKSLVEDVGAAMGAVGRQHAITFTSDGEVRIATDKAVSIGVIVTELVTNALKYAYPADVSGNIRVSLRRSADDTAALAVEDDGVGWTGEGKTQGSGLGSRIIKAMAGNLQTVLTYEPAGRGTRAVMAFRT